MKFNRAEREEAVKTGAKAVQRLSLPDQIAAALRREIFTGARQPGDKLLSERELADQFGTSRLTLRKALALLAQEGWIEIVQGRNMAVADFRTSVGLEVLPELFFSCPEAVLTPRLLETIVGNSAWLYQQILIAASKQARPEDESRLLAILSGQTEKLGLEEFYENEFGLYHELLRLGGNLALQMAYNSQVRLSRKLLALGIVRDPPYPLARYHDINRSLLKAVCAGDEPGIKSLLEKYQKDMEDSFIRWFQNLGRKGRE